MRQNLLATFLFTTVSMQGALAAGYAVREQSADAMASAYAGAAATGTDASYLAYNPAAAAATDGGDFSLNAVAIDPNSSASYSTALTSAGTQISGSKTAANFIRNAIIPSFSLRQRLSAHWSTEIIVSVPWGLSTNYPASFVGRYYSEDTKLQTLNITPVVAYDVAPGLTVAGGLQAQYATGLLTSAVDIGTIGAASGIPGSMPGAMDGTASVNARGWGYGFVLGVRAALNDGWTLGLSYHSRVKQPLNGPLTFSLDSEGLGAAIKGATGLLSNTTERTKLTTPDVAEFGLRKTIDDHWTGLMEVDWTGWSAFKELDIVAANPVQPNDVTNAQWHDSWMAAIGAEYALDDSWSFRAGSAYDGSPIPSSTLETRVPDANRYWLSGGATYHASDVTDLKLTLSHLFVDSRDISQSAVQTGNALRGILAGKTKSSVDVVGVGIDYRWR